MTVESGKKIAVWVAGIGLGTALWSLRAGAQETAPSASTTIHFEETTEIVVTARKFQESIQDVPLSVTAFSADEMEQRGYSRLEDIAAATPGFTYEGFMSGGAHGNPVIRGLAQTFTTARVQNVSFFLDGVYLQRQSMLDLGMVDMERIEVVKGPQNALYGRNAFAGAVNYVTEEPSDALTGYLSAETGDNEREEYRFSLSGPLTASGSLRAKVAAGFRSYDGATENDHPLADADPPGPNLRGNLGGFDDKTYSASILFQPMDSLRMRAGFYRSETEHETQPGYSISGVGAARFGLRLDAQNDLNCNPATVRDISGLGVHRGNTAFCGELPKYASDAAPRTANGIIVDPRAIGTIADTDVWTFGVDYDITSNLSAHYLFGYADHNAYTDGGASDEDPLAGRGILTNGVLWFMNSQNPAAYTFVNTSSGRPNTELESRSHELRFDWQPTDGLKTSIGGYYSKVEDEEWTSLFISDLCNAANANNIGNCSEPLSTPNTVASRTVLTVAQSWDQYTRQSGGNLKGEWTAYEESISAMFASVTFDFTDTLQATVEGRYTEETKKVVRLTDSQMLAPGQTITYRQPTAPVLPIANTLTSQIVVPRDSADFSDFTPRAILNWSFADHHMAYVSAAKGVKSGGFNNAITESELTYDEETNWTYELGVKNTFGRRLTLNGSIYYVDWSDLQMGVPPAVAGLSTSDIISNVGGADSYGAELQVDLRVVDWLSVDFAGSYNDATYKDGTKYASGEQVNGSIHCNGVVCPADGDISGNQLARTSEFQYAAGLNFNTSIFNWSLNARLDTTYLSKQFVDPLNLAWVPSRQVENLSMSLLSPDQHWQLDAWCKNLTDEDYVANAFLIGQFNQYMVAKGELRTFGVSLKYAF